MCGVYFRLCRPSSLLLRRNVETGIGRMADGSFSNDCNQRLVSQTATPDRGVSLARMAREANDCSSRRGLDSSMTRVESRGGPLDSDSASNSPQRAKLKGTGVGIVPAFPDKPVAFHLSS